MENQPRCFRGHSDTASHELAQARLDSAFVMRVECRCWSEATISAQSGQSSAAGTTHSLRREGELYTQSVSSYSDQLVSRRDGERTRRVLQNRPRDRDALLLASTEPHASFSDPRFVLVGERHDLVVHRAIFRRRDDILHRDLASGTVHTTDPAVRDVVPRRLVEQDGI